MDWNLVTGIIVALAAFIGVVFTSALWLSKQFSAVRNLVYDKTEQLKEFIIEKIEYHEKHDDQRFSQLNKDMQANNLAVSNDIWAIKLRNATIDGRVVGSAISNNIEKVNN